MECKIIEQSLSNFWNLVWDYINKYWKQYLKANKKIAESNLSKVVFNNKQVLLGNEHSIKKTMASIISSEKKISWNELKTSYWPEWEFLYEYITLFEPWWEEKWLTVWFMLKKYRPYILNIDIWQFVTWIKWQNLLKIYSWLWLSWFPIWKLKFFWKKYYWPFKEKTIHEVTLNPNEEIIFWENLLFDSWVEIDPKIKTNIATMFAVWNNITSTWTWKINKVINWIYTTAASWYWFIKYTLSVLSWWLMFWISAAWYDNLERTVGKWLLNSAMNWRKELSIMTHPVYEVIYQTLWEIQSMWEWWADYLTLFYKKLWENLWKYLEKTPISSKSRKELINYLMATKNWIHNIADLVYDESMRNLAFSMALQYLHWITPEVLASGKIIKEWDEAYLLTKEWELLHIWNISELSDETYQYYRKLKAYWTFTPDNVRVWAWKMFERLFNFYWTWGLIMMNNFIKSLPLWIYYLTKSRLAKTSVEKEAYMKEAMFHIWLSYTMIWSILTSWFYWSQVYKFRDKKWESDNTNINYIEHLLKSAKIFSVRLQSFDSNVYWRLLEASVDDEPTSLWFKIFSELNRDFLKNLHLIDPFAAAATEFINTKDIERSTWILREWLTNSMEWYIRFLWADLPDWLWWYVLPKDWNWLFDLLLWDKTWLSKIYNELKNIEKEKDIDNLYKKWKYSDIVTKYILFNIPILKWINSLMFYGDEYKSTAQKLEEMYNNLESDKNFLKMRYEWELPDIDSLDPSIQNEYVKYLFKRLSAQIPYWAKFDKDEMKQIVYTLNDKFLENNIIAEWLKDYIIKWDISKLYKAYMNAYSEWWTEEKANLIRQNAYIMSLLQSKIPWAAYKIMGKLFNDMSSYIRKKRFWTYKASWVPEDMEQWLEKEMVKMFYPYLMFHDDWSWNINALLYTEAMQKYIELAHPEYANLFKWKWKFWWDDYDIKNLNRKIFKLMMLDVVAHNKMNQWDINAVDIKNVFSLLWWKLFDNIKEKAWYIKTILDKINWAMLSDTQKTNLETWVILANLDIYDDIKKNWIPKWVENVYKSLIKYLFNTNKDINNLEHTYKVINNKNNPDTPQKNYWKKRYNNNYKKNYPAYNAFKKYYNKWYNNFKPYYKPYNKNYWWWYWIWQSPFSYSWYNWKNQYIKPMNLSARYILPKMYHINSQAITKRLIHDLSRNNKNEARWFTVKAPSISRAKPTGIPWLTSGRRR